MAVSGINYENNNSITNYDNNDNISNNNISDITKPVLDLGYCDHNNIITTTIYKLILIQFDNTLQISF